jgi:DNA-binding transcriptional MerR regulator
MIAANDEFVSSQTEESQTFTIEQVAAKTGLTKRTLRYYEEVGLLPPTGRTEGNYRRYTKDDIQRLENIKRLRDLLGFSLADIREIMEAEDERWQIKAAYKNETEAAAKIVQLDRSDELIRKQLHLIEQKITGLEEMRSTLQSKIEWHQQVREKLLKDQ